jgi:hypothetical protein
MQSKKPIVLSAAVLVLSGQAASALAEGKVISFDVPVTSLTALSSAGTDTGLILRFAPDTMLDQLNTLPPPDIPGVTVRPGIRDTGSIDTG